MTEPADPHFPVQQYQDCTDLNDNVPWQPNGVLFDSRRVYSPVEQDQVTQSERRIFNATEKWVTEFGSRKKELEITHPDHRQASLPQPISEFATSELSTPPEAASQGSTVHSLGNSFGNQLFGSTYVGVTEHTYTRSANEARMRISSNATISASIFSNINALVRFVVTSDCICNLPSLGTRPGSVSVVGNYYLLGQQVSVGNWPSGFAPHRPNSRVFERVGYRFVRRRQRFMVGPVPMMLEAAVRGTASLDVEVNPNCPQVTLDITPRADLFVDSSWSVNVRIIRAGIRANLSLLTLTMPMRATLGIEPDFCARWTANLTRSARTLDGNIELFTTVRFLFFQEKFTLNIARWNGITLREENRFREGRFCPLPS